MYRTHPTLRIVIITHLCVHIHTKDGFMGRGDLGYKTFSVTGFTQVRMCVHEHIDTGTQIHAHKDTHAHSTTTHTHTHTHTRVCVCVRQVEAHYEITN